MRAISNKTGGYITLQMSELEEVTVVETPEPQTLNLREADLAFHKQDKEQLLQLVRTHSKFIY
jgi:hypothetical protein